MSDIRLEPVDFDEAIEFFRDKLPIPPNQFYSLAFDARAKAFTVSGISSLDIIFDIYKELDRAITDGLTMEEFRKSSNEILERKGWRGLTPYRADNVFRTNVQTAYNVGRYNQMADPETLSRRPYWQYDAVEDTRTRRTHLAMDGKVFPADHSFWDTWYPPNGFRCRCSVRSLTESNVKRKGLEISDEIPKYVEPPGELARPLIPDPGFAYNPARSEWKPDLSKYPPDLRDEYLRRAVRS